MARHGLERVAVLDWDVHHGNGTQQAFWERDDVLTLSLHHDNNYPLDSGGLEERGERAGLGYNINVPLPAGSGIGAACMERPSTLRPPRGSWCSGSLLHWLNLSAS